jgi:Leucine-rich repeat (LRR) protein
LADVRSLHISGASELKKSDFSGLSNLQWLDLIGGELPWDVIKNLDNLKELDLGYNNLSELPPGTFDGLGNLQTLDLSDNNLSELPPGIFDGLYNLQGLYLGNNNLNELPPGVFDGLDNLLALDLDGNPGDPFNINVGVCGRTPAVRAALEKDVTRRNCASITDIDLADVDSLHIRSDRLSELTPGVFDGLDNLQSLDLRGDNLSELSRACSTAWTTCKR